jgi:hypothetical protein
VPITARGLKLKVFQVINQSFSGVQDYQNYIVNLCFAIKKLQTKRLEYPRVYKKLSILSLGGQKIIP